MNKLKTLLALLAVCLGAWQSAHARTAPAMPATKTLESGKTYYLYNVESDRFLYRNSSYAYACTDKGTPVKISVANGTQYTMQYTNDNYYLYNYRPELYSTSSSSSDACKFTFIPTDGGYLIQSGSTYVGIKSGSTRIDCDLTEGNIVWQLMDADEAAHYIALRNLYRAIETAESNGYTIGKYDALYEDATSSNYVLQDAADRLNKGIEVGNSIGKPSWTDYPILFEMDPANPWYVSGSEISKSVSPNGYQELRATVTVDDDATLVYYYSPRYTGDSYKHHLDVYLDGELQYSINRFESDKRCFVEMQPGTHEITWRFKVEEGSYGNNCRIYNIGVQSTPTITVSLLEPGSIGTEVLKQTEHIQNVRKLVVRGEMNTDDWARILMMNRIFSLDLTDAIVTEIPEKQLSRSYHSNELSSLHEVKLPKTLKKIGDYAFYGTYIDAIEFPEGLESIGNSAFEETKVREAMIPESVTYVGNYAFENDYSLERVSYPAAAQTIPNGCFYECYALQPFEIPEGIVSVNYEAFRECHSFNSSLPSTLTNIGSYAFFNTSIDNVVINEGTWVGSDAFYGSPLTNITLPTTFYEEVEYLTARCKNLTNVWFKSPTMVISSKKNMFYDTNMQNITLHVPQYLVTTYKQDSYWYNCNVVGFSTADVTDWVIRQPLKMSVGERFEGTPNVTVTAQGTWTLNGDDAMTLNNFSTDRQGNNVGLTSLIMSHCDNIRINGDYRQRYYTWAKYWYFVVLPFDMRVGDIECPCSYAIRYYDGASRAENGTGGNWKNYEADDIIPAGTGFIFQTSQEVWTAFKAVDNASKQYVFSNKEFVKALDAHNSDIAANKGWNLVGNPWLTYYNIHKLNFTAPITVWNVSNRNYSAYSIIDDDYAILPGQAFFVQCPDEINSISFPIDGRQMTSKIESQNAMPGKTPTAKERQIIDLTLSDEALSDRTRLVVNNRASMAYETTCDASKFFSMDSSVPQIYSINDGIQYAINERPQADGILHIGILIPADGTYTIEAGRNELQGAILTDTQTGTDTCLDHDSYTFHATAGTDESRFVLRLAGAAVTGIRTIADTDNAAQQPYYNLNGQRVNAPQHGVYIQNGKKVIIK